jgi:aminopeptidase S
VGAARPEPTALGSVRLQLGAAYSGQLAMVTGGKADGSASANDLDGGSTTIRSAPIALPSTVGSLTFRYYFAHGPNSSKADSFQVYVEAGGVKTRVFREYGTAFADAARWVKAGRRSRSGPARRSGSCSWPPTAAPTARSRPAWTT